MVSGSDTSPSLIAAAIAIAASAALWWLGTAVEPRWWAAWLAPGPVLALAMRTNARTAALAAALSWAIGGLNHWSYLATVHVPVVVRVLADAFPALVFAFAALLAHVLARRGFALAATFALPASWTAAEYANAATSPHGTAFALAYSQMDALPVIQTAALCGAWGIGFLVLLPASAAAVAMAPATSRASRWVVAASAVAVVAIAIGFGSWRVHAAGSEPTTNVRIGLASIQARRNIPLGSPEGQRLQARYLAIADRLADRGAQIVVLPETAFAASGTERQGFADFARARHAAIDVGIDDRHEAGVERNVSALFRPGLVAPDVYAKRHLIPFLEDRYTPGTDPVVSGGQPRMGLAVCKDMDFPATGRELADRDAHLLLVPAWDFEVDAWLHSRMAVLRGVESGLAIARSARDGSLTLSDDRGRVVAEAHAIGADSEASVVGTLSVRETRTLYARWGDWFAWVAIAVAAGCILLLPASAAFRKR